MPDAPFHYACDSRWWDRYYDDVKAGFNGESYTINDKDKSLNPSDKYDLIRCNSRHGNSLSKEFIHYGVQGGGNSGYQAVNLAYQKGAKVILLLGFDMHGDHFFGKHPRGLNGNSPFNSFIESFKTIDCKTLGIEIINCTRKTALNCFPKMNLESALLLAQDQA